jgi:hypothetical protein
MDASITSTHIWAAAGSTCIILTGALGTVFKLLQGSWERRVKSLENAAKEDRERAKEERERCAATYADIAKRLRDTEDIRYSDSVAANREMVAALRESTQANREMAVGVHEIVKASGRCARVVELISQAYGIQIAARSAEPAARKDESSQEFILPQPAEKFTTHRHGQDGGR